MREDFYYKISSCVVKVPPLRERKEDIPFFVAYFLPRGWKITKKAMEKLLNYNWPSNINELKYCIEYAVIVSKNQIIEENNLPPKIYHFQANKKFQTLEELEKKYIEEILLYTKGNITKASKILGINRKTLRNKIRKYNINI